MVHVTRARRASSGLPRSLRLVALDYRGVGVDLEAGARRDVDAGGHPAKSKRAAAADLVTATVHGALPLRRYYDERGTAKQPRGGPMTTTRTEKDSMVTIEVPSDRYCGAQPQRSLEHLVGRDPFPARDPGAGISRSSALVTGARLLRGEDPGHRAGGRGGHEGKLDAISLGRLQPGSGTRPQEAKGDANRATALGGRLGYSSRASQRRRQPHQYSNDTFPPMHIAGVESSGAAERGWGAAGHAVGEARELNDS